MSSFNINTNFTAYKNCESSLDRTLNSFCSSKTASIFDNNSPEKNSNGVSGASRRLKNMFRSIDQKISLLDLKTQDNCSPNLTNKANDLFIELRESNASGKEAVMNKVDNFFGDLKKSGF